MSLICLEDDKPIRIIDEAFCVTAAASDQFSAICVAHIQSIAPGVREKERIENGPDIYFLFSKPNALLMFTDNLSLRDAQFGDYRFSIRRELARLILPRSYELYL